MAVVTKADVVKTRRASKDHRINIRVPADVKSTLVRAAEVSGRSLTDFIADSALDAARTAIEEAAQVRLAEQDRIVFLEALSNPPAPNEALKEAALRHQKLTE